VSASKPAAVVVVVAATLVLACGVSSAPQGSEDERGAVGVPDPATKYCEDLGYQSRTVSASETRCVFPDGTSCEEWAFYRAECGQTHSYCNVHGGNVRREERDAGSFTEDVAMCDLDGKSCTEESFWESGKCE
jgi:putative hemolysin